ncbi:hypothetical protein LCGC14_2870860, partial [marine sediment metagenome]
SKGISITNINDVTTKNCNIKNFVFGIYLYNSNSSLIINNTFNNNSGMWCGGYMCSYAGYGIHHTRGSQNNLINNRIIDDYDYIFIDCPPNMGSASQNALFASDAFIIPIIPDPLSFQGFPELINSASQTLKIAERRRDDHKKPICGGLILSHSRNTLAMRNTTEDIRNMLTIFKDGGKLNENSDIFLSKITYRTAIPDAQGQGTILATTRKKSASQTEFEDLAYEFDRKFKDLL